MDYNKKKIYILGGGTFSHVRTHFSLAAPAFGKAAKQLKQLCDDRFPEMEVVLKLTKMADSTSDLVTNKDVEEYIDHIIMLNTTKIIFFNVAMCDFDGKIADIDSGKYAERLSSAEQGLIMNLTPAEKVIKKIREKRKDIFLIGFKTTANESEQAMYLKGLNLMKKNHCNLVLANDVVTKKNLIITPEEAKYAVTEDRNYCLTELVDISFYRSQLTFTKSTVVDGIPVSWDSEEVYPALRTVVDYCVEQGAYKVFNGATVGHFACKINDNTFLTSIRKTNFNDIKKNGLVKVVTDGPDSVIAYGAKPSVGGQSQRIVFSDHPNYDCIVHFHCPMKEGSLVPVRSQREIECGSHSCGKNVSDNLGKFNDGRISAVMLDNHGPNIVFHHSIDPQEVINFINDNFILEQKTGGFVEVDLTESIKN